MPFERRNPLPKGRYWIDVIERPAGRMAEFGAWALNNEGKVNVESTEEKTDSDPPRLFVIFQVLEPVFFPVANFGLPTIATDDVHHSDDTAEKPEVKEPTVQDLASALTTFGGLLLGAAGLLFLSKFVGKGK